MKKLFLTAIVALMAVGAANAQWYIGGNLGVDFGNSTTKTTADVKGPSSFGFEIAPRVGYMFNDNKFIVGAEINFRMDQNKTFAPDYTISTTSFGITPYFRWNFVNWGIFNIGAEARLDFGYDMMKDDPKTMYDSENAMRIGFGVVPVVSFNISKNFMLETHLNILKLDYTYKSTKTTNVGGGETTKNSNALNFAFDGDNLFKFGEITIGIVYKF